MMKPKKRYPRFRKERLRRSGTVPPPRRIGDGRGDASEYYTGEWDVITGPGFGDHDLNTAWIEGAESVAGNRLGFLGGNDYISNYGNQYARWAGNQAEGRICRYPAYIVGYVATGNETPEELVELDYVWMPCIQWAFRGKLFPVGYLKYYFRGPSDPLKNDWGRFQVTPSEEKNGFYAKCLWWFGDELPAEFPHGPKGYEEI